MRRMGAALAAVLIGVGTAAGAAHAAPAAATSGVRHVQVRGHSVALDCTGRGGPTIILFAGFGDNHTVWRSIQQHLARHTRVCSYDRLGEGTSSQPHRTQTLASNVRLLHAVLGKARVAGPYVLVGHSIGGDVATAYARIHPRATAGLVTFDATPPGYLNFVRKLIPAGAGGIDQALRQEAVGILSGHNPERLKVVRATWAPPRALRHTPVAIVEHGKNIFAAAGKYGAPLQRHWSRGQRQLAKFSWRSQLIVATRSGHYIYLDQPRLALDVINAVVAES
jgi:pimeloyl-ACP methyl ester carboxylesterase